MFTQLLLLLLLAVGAEGYTKDLIATKTAIRKNHLIATLKTVGPEYKVILEFMPSGARSGYGRVLYFETAGTKFPLPAVYYNGYQRNIEVQTHVDGENYAHHVKSISLNAWHRVEVTQKKEGGTYYFSVAVDGKFTVRRVANPTAKRYYGVKVYASDGNYDTQTGFIRKLEVESDEIESKEPKAYGGWCLKPNGKDENAGTIRVTAFTKNGCLTACKKNQNAKGCEWLPIHNICIVHTNQVCSGSDKGSHSCWVLKSNDCPAGNTKVLIATKTAIRKNHLIATLENFGPEYKVTLEFMPNGKKTSWRAVMYSETAAGIKYPFPGVFYNGFGRAIAVGMRVGGRYFERSLYYRDLNAWHTVEVTQKKEGGTYYYTLVIDGKQIIRRTNPYPRRYSGVKVYASGGKYSHPYQPGFIRKLEVESNEIKSKAKAKELKECSGVHVSFQGYGTPTAYVADKTTKYSAKTLKACCITCVWSGKQDWSGGSRPLRGFFYVESSKECNCLKKHVGFRAGGGNQYYTFY